MFPALSTSEVQVFILYSSGVTTKEIAEKFGISVNTVNSHINNTQIKYGLRSFFDLRTVYMCQHSLVTMRPFVDTYDFLPDLTCNEIKAYELYAKGHSDRSTANRLGVCTSLINENIVSIRKKLDLNMNENLRAAFCYKMSLYAMQKLLYGAILAYKLTRCIFVCHNDAKAY